MPSKKHFIQWTFNVLNVYMGHNLTKVLCNNTVVERVNGNRSIGIRLHGHLIIMLHDGDEYVSIRHASWDTVTTFDRLSRAMPDGWGVSRASGYPVAYSATKRSRENRVPIYAYDWLLIRPGGIEYKHSPDPYAERLTVV